MDKLALTAQCGLDCFNCELFENNLTEDLKQIIHTKLGIPLDEIRCQGCRVQDGKHFHLPEEGCSNLDCVKDMGVNLCCECDEFPCALLLPRLQRGQRIIHTTSKYTTFAG